MTHDSLIELFKDVLLAEEQAIQIYENFLKKSNKTHINKIISKILKDEYKHKKNAEKALKILKE